MHDFEDVARSLLGFGDVFVGSEEREAQQHLETAQMETELQRGRVKDLQEMCFVVFSVCFFWFS